MSELTDIVTHKAPAANDVPGMAQFIVRAISKFQVARLERDLARSTEVADRDRLQVAIRTWSDPGQWTASSSAQFSNSCLVLAKAIAAGDCVELFERLHTRNGGSRAAFSQITGVSLPATEKGTQFAVASWAGTTREAVLAKIDQVRIAAEGARRAQEIRNAYARQRSLANAVSVTTPDSDKPIGTIATFIEGVYASGCTELTKVGKGAVKHWALVQPGTDLGHKLGDKRMSAYAKALVQLRELEQDEKAAADQAATSATPTEELVAACDAADHEDDEAHEAPRN